MEKSGAGNVLVSDGERFEVGSDRRRDRARGNVRKRTLQIAKIGKIVDEHWGDLVALYILHLGILLVWRAKGDPGVAHIGESLILLAAGTLRFRRQESKPDDGHIQPTPQG